MGRCLVLCALIAAPACYRPSIEAACSVACETPGGAGACPGEQVCGDDLRCRSAGDVDCSKQHGVDAAGEVCVGQRFLSVCFVPRDDVMLQNETINTDSDHRCDLVPGPSGYPQVCAITGRNVTVIGNVVVTGTRPFAIAATESVAVMGTLDAASHISQTAGPAANVPVPTCSDAVEAVTGLGGSGGYGGSFQAIGGAGGKGATMGGGNGGAPSKAVTKEAILGLSGACASGTGSNGDTANGGAGGAGGGAIALLGGDVSIAGFVNVSGAGGSGGRLDAGGGGGGGAGGMVLIDGSTITISGIIVANGGGGGGGGGVGPGAEGLPGLEPTMIPPFDGVAGGAAGGAGGHGGAGGGSDTANGSLGLLSSTAAGGGGGGGVGYILVTMPVTGMMSPAPTAF